MAEVVSTGEKKNNTTSIETIVNDTIKELKKNENISNISYDDQIKQSIINVIRYKLDNAKENDLEAKKKMWEDTGYITRGQILIDAPSDETSHKPKSWAMIKNIGNTMVAPERARRRMWRSKDKSANLNDVILNSIKRAKTGECFTFGKHFRTTGTSNLDSHDAKIFTEFCIYATYNLYHQLTEELETDIKSADSDKLNKKTKRDTKNESIQQALQNFDSENINTIIPDLSNNFDLDKNDQLIKTLNKLFETLPKKTINLQIKNELNTIIEQIKFLIEQIKDKKHTIDNEEATIDDSNGIQLEIDSKKIKIAQLTKEKNLIEEKMETRKQEFIKNLQDIIYKIEQFEYTAAEAEVEAAATTAEKAGAAAVPDTINYEIEKFCNKYFQYFFEFARINIYVIVNCSSILNDLAKALALLIGLQLKKSIGTAKQDKLVKDGLSKDTSNKANKSLTEDMKEANLFGSGAFFNMYSLNIIKYIGFIYENSIPEIERLIGSVNDKYNRLKILDNYLTSKYEKMVLGKESHQKDNEKYEIDNPFIKNLLQDIFPNMGFSDGSIRKNIQNIDRVIEEHSDNIDLLQAKLEKFLPINFQGNGLLFANKKIQEIMFQENDIKKLKEIIDEKTDKKEQLTRLLAQAQVKASPPATAPPAAAPA